MPLSYSLLLKATQLWSKALDRNDQDDKARNALNVMNRFKIFFQLPRNIEASIAKGKLENHIKV